MCLRNSKKQIDADQIQDKKRKYDEKNAWIHLPKPKKCEKMKKKNTAPKEDAPRTMKNDNHTEWERMQIIIGRAHRKRATRITAQQKRQAWTNRTPRDARRIAQRNLIKFIIAPLLDVSKRRKGIQKKSKALTSSKEHRLMIKNTQRSAEMLKNTSA